MKNLVIYIHGKGGTYSEAEHYIPLFPDCDIIGFDYKSKTPWEAKEEMEFLDNWINKISTDGNCK